MIATLGKWANMPMSVAMALAWQLMLRRRRCLPTAEIRPDAVNDRFATSAGGTFTTKFAPFLPYIESLSNSTIPDDWAEQGDAIFITWPMHHLKAMGPIVSAMIAGLLCQRMQRPWLQAVFAIDEAPGGSVGQLGGLYGDRGRLRGDAASQYTERPAAAE